MMFPGLHPMAMMSTVGMGFPRGAAPAAAAMYPPGAQPYAAGGVYPAGMMPPTGSQQVNRRSSFPRKRLVESVEE